MNFEYEEGATKFTRTMSNSGTRNHPVQLPRRHPADRPASRIQSRHVLWPHRPQRLLNIAMQTAARAAGADHRQTPGAASL